MRRVVRAALTAVGSRMTAGLAPLDNDDSEELKVTEAIVNPIVSAAGGNIADGE
jgi:hypothetical protein